MIEMVERAFLRSYDQRVRRRERHSLRVTAHRLPSKAIRLRTLGKV
jgi:hypothetical protein